MNSSIVQLRSWNGRAIRQREDGFMCLTDMAYACDKKIGHWNEAKSTKSYLETLSDVIGIPITDLIEVNQGGIPDQQGTWGHRKVAIRFAQWCSDEFAIQVDTWIEELLTTGKVELKQLEPERNLDTTDIELIRLTMSTINPVLVDGYLLGEVAKARPHLKEHVKEGLKLLASVSDIPEVLLTPTVIGAELGISARAVNKLLLQHGYQVKNPMKTGKRGTKSLPDYVATELGQPYAEVTFSTGMDTATYQHLKWQQSIVEVLSQHVGV